MNYNIAGYGNSEDKKKLEILREELEQFHRLASRNKKLPDAIRRL